MNNFDYLNNFLSTLDLEGYSKGTIKVYRHVIQKFLSHFSKSISEISTSDIRSYLLDYKQDHQISNVTLNNYQRYISSFFTWLTREKIIKENPCDNLKAIKTPKVMKDYFTEEEMNKIRNSCSNKRQKAIIEVLYSSGLRVSELVSLNKNDINWARGMANIIGKGNKERTVYFSDEALRLLKDYLDTRDDKNEALFVTMVKPVKRLSIESIESSMRELGRRISIRVYPHKFRHTCATVLLEKGMSIQDVSEVLGHSRLETTMIYITLNKNKILEKYKECMNGARAK